LRFCQFCQWHHSGASDGLSRHSILTGTLQFAMILRDRAAEA
jgi:hypothetical protein